MLKTGHILARIGPSLLLRLEKLHQLESNAWMCHPHAATLLLAKHTTGRHTGTSEDIAIVACLSCFSFFCLVIHSLVIC